MNDGSGPLLYTLPMTILSTILAKLAAAITSLGMLIGLVHAPVAVPAANVPLQLSTTTQAVTAQVANNSNVTPEGVFTDKKWSLAFTLRPEWNVHEILDANNQLHQMQITGKTLTIFISKNEGIRLSDDLASTVAGRTIDGAMIDVRTYANPGDGFAYYQLFTVAGKDGTYTFLAKSTSADTTLIDTFIRSIKGI